jgi:hypothetical protein
LRRASDIEKVSIDINNDTLKLQRENSWNVGGVFPGARGGQSELNSKPQNHERFGCGATKIAGVFTSREVFIWQLLKLQLVRGLKFSS